MERAVQTAPVVAVAVAAAGALLVPAAALLEPVAGPSAAGARP